MKKMRKAVAACLGMTMLLTTAFGTTVAMASETEAEISGSVELWNDKLAAEDPTVVDAMPRELRMHQAFR